MGRGGRGRGDEREGGDGADARLTGGPSRAGGGRRAPGGGRPRASRRSPPRRRRTTTTPRRAPPPRRTRPETRRGHPRAGRRGDRGTTGAGRRKAGRGREGGPGGAGGRAAAAAAEGAASGRPGGSPRRAGKTEEADPPRKGHGGGGAGTATSEKGRRARGPSPPPRHAVVADDTPSLPLPAGARPTDARPAHRHRRASTAPPGGGRGPFLPPASSSRGPVLAPRTDTHTRAPALSRPSRPAGRHRAGPPAPHGGRLRGRADGREGRGASAAAAAAFSVNDPSAGSPTETLLRLLLPLDSQVRPSSQHSARAVGRPRRGRSEGLTKPSNR